MSGQVSVLFFASLREDVGMAELTVEAGSVSEVLAALRAQLAPDAMQALEQENVRIAVNQELVEQDTSLAAGDEVAFLPPVTGG